MSEETLKFRVQFTLEMHSRQLHILHIGYRRIKNPFTYYGWVKKLEQILSSPSITHQGTLETMTAIARLFCSNSSLIFRCHQDVHCYKMCWMLLGAVSKRNGFCTLLDGHRAPFWLSSTYTFPNSNFFLLLPQLSKVKPDKHYKKLWARFLTWSITLCKVKEAFLEFGQQMDLVTKTLILRLFSVCLFLKCI